MPGVVRMLPGAFYGRPQPPILGAKKKKKNYVGVPGAIARAGVDRACLFAPMTTILQRDFVTWQHLRSVRCLAFSALCDAAGWPAQLSDLSRKWTCHKHSDALRRCEATFWYSPSFLFHNLVRD